MVSNKPVKHHQTVPLAPHKNTIEPKSKNSRCIMMSEMLFI